VANSPYFSARDCEKDHLYSYKIGDKHFLVRFIEEVITDHGTRWQFEVVIAPKNHLNFEGLGFCLHDDAFLRHLTDMEVLAMAAR